MRVRFSAKDPRSLLLRFHSQTAGSTLTAQQSDVNVVRVAIQALAAVLGGTQSLHTNSRDEALALPSESAVTIALRTQQVIAHETGVPDVRRSARRQLRDRSAHRRAGDARVRLPGADSISSAAWCARSRKATRSARSKRPPTRRSARSSPASK